LAQHNKSGIISIFLVVFQKWFIRLYLGIVDFFLCLWTTTGIKFRHRNLWCITVSEFLGVVANSNGIIVFPSCCYNYSILPKFFICKSKSLSNKRSCTIRYLSNSLSVNDFAISVVTFPALSKTSLSTCLLPSVWTIRKFRIVAVWVEPQTSFVFLLLFHKIAVHFHFQFASKKDNVTNLLVKELFRLLYLKKSSRNLRIFEIHPNSSTHLRNLNKEQKNSACALSFEQKNLSRILSLNHSKLSGATLSRIQLLILLSTILP